MLKGETHEGRVVHNTNKAKSS